MGKKKDKSLKKQAKLASKWESECGGKSILETYWDELDSIMDRLMTDGAEAADGRDPGRAEGVAYCIAVLVNPYHPDIDSIRIQAVDRWNEANAQDLAPAFDQEDRDQHGEYPQQAEEM